MNTTTRTFPRTLAEAFPDSLEASRARAAYGCAITRYRSDFPYARVSEATGMAVVVSFLLGVFVTALVLA